MKYCYDYPRPAVTVDAAVFRKQAEEWQLLLIRRGNDPFKGMFALPGGFVEMDETLETAVERELLEETGISGVRLEQLHTFSNIDRDPRHRTISTIFWGVLDDPEVIANAGDDASEVQWISIPEMPALAFDHDEVVLHAVKKLEERLSKVKP